MFPNRVLIKLIVLFVVHNIAANFNFNDIRNHLGTKTPYRFKLNKNDSKIKFPGCKDAKIWMIVRHGTRLPGVKDIEGINKLLKVLRLEILLQHKLGKGQLNEEELKSFEDWSSDINPEEEKYLTEEGKDEMKQLAKRVRNRFPNAIKRKYDNETFLIRYTATERAQQSAKFFAIGLFDKKNVQDVNFILPPKIDPVLRFYKYCDKWQRQVKHNTSTYEEQHLFGKGPEMSQAIEKISQRLGLKQNLTVGTANLIYKVCGFETAWQKHHISPWCHAFDGNTIKMLEYYNDIKHYWIDGYGQELTHQQACVSVKNMFDNFSNANVPTATFFFSHSGTLLKILAHLKLYKPENHLRGDNMAENKVWKTSDIDCFATNLAFVLFECENGAHVLTLHQERIIKLPMCDTELCPLDVVRKAFHNSIYNCNYADMCNLSRKYDEL